MTDKIYQKNWQSGEFSHPALEPRVYQDYTLNHNFGKQPDNVKMYTYVTNKTVITGFTSIGTTLNAPTDQNLNDLLEATDTLTLGQQVKIVQSIAQDGLTATLNSAFTTDLVITNKVIVTHITTPINTWFQSKQFFIFSGIPGTNDLYSQTQTDNLNNTIVRVPGLDLGACQIRFECFSDGDVPPFQWKTNEEQEYPFEKAGENGDITLYCKEISIPLVFPNQTMAIPHDINGFKLSWLYGLNGRLKQELKDPIIGFTSLGTTLNVPEEQDLNLILLVNDKITAVGETKTVTFISPDGLFAVLDTVFTTDLIVTDEVVITREIVKAPLVGFTSLDEILNAPEGEDLNVLLVIGDRITAHGELRNVDGIAEDGLTATLDAGFTADLIVTDEVVITSDDISTDKISNLNYVDVADPTANISLHLTNTNLVITNGKNRISCKIKIMYAKESIW